MSVSEHHYSPRILTPSPIVSAAFIAAHLKRIDDRVARPDRAAQQSGARGRGAGDARHDGAGAAGRRAAAGHDERGADLRPQPGGGARADRRGDGADPARVDGAAALRLAGPPLPVPDRLHLAAPAAAAASADLRAGHEPRVLRVRRAPPSGVRRVLRARSRSWPRPRATTASSARATAGSRRPSRSSTGRTCSWPRPTTRLTRCCARSRAGRRSPCAPACARPCTTLDSRNIAGEARAPVVTGALPTTFIGSPDTVVEQVRRCREVVGAGVLDLSLHPPGSTTSSRSCARSSCSAGRCCRGFARSERTAGPRSATARSRWTGARFRYVEAGQGSAAGPPVRRRRAASHAGPRACCRAFPRGGVRGARRPDAERQPERGPRDRRRSASRPFNLMGTSIHGAYGARSGAAGAGAACAPSCWKRPPRSGPTPRRGPRAAAWPSSRRRPSCCSARWTTWSCAVGRIYKARIAGCHLVFVYARGPRHRADRPEAFTEVVVDFFERREAFVISRATTLINP